MGRGRRMGKKVTPWMPRRGRREKWLVLPLHPPPSQGYVKVWLVWSSTGDLGER